MLDTPRVPLSTNTTVSLDLIPLASFTRFWRTYLVRQALLEIVQPEELQSLRLVCHEVSWDVAPYLFQHISINFDANTFSRHSRMVALERIGHHVKTLSFTMPHTAATFLPPLIAPDTLEEFSFIYEPQVTSSRPVSASSASSCSTYGSWEMDDLLIKHYPPVFHAATDIPAFTRAIRALPNMRKLEISCPGQDSCLRYRRNAVDFALISLRVAVEQATPRALTSLVLKQIHPGAPFSLRPQASYGSSPASTRAWRRIKSLTISMQSFDFGCHLPADHLKILHTYLQSFPAIKHLDFEWLGAKGPCPLSLKTEPCATRPTSFDSNNTCEQMSTVPCCRPIRWRQLRTMYLRNATLDAGQAASFVGLHRKVLEEFGFNACELRSGSWEDALAPLNQKIRTDRAPCLTQEVMSVPLMLSPVQDHTETDYVLTTLWEDQQTRSRGVQALRRLGLKTRETVPQRVRQMFKMVRLGWRAWD